MPMRKLYPVYFPSKMRILKILTKINPKGLTNWEGKVYTVPIIDVWD